MAQASGSADDMTLAPFSQLYQNISATMLALGLSHSDEAAFKTWAYSAWIDSGFTPCHAVLSQPATSLLIQFGVRVATAGHKVNVWWGDGTSNSYTPDTGANTECVKTYGAGALRPVVVIGRVSHFESNYGDGRTTFGGRIQGLGTALTYLQVWGNNTLSGSISALTALTQLSAGGNNTLSGSVSALTALTYLGAWGNNTLSGSVSALTALTYLGVEGLNTITGWELVAASAPGLCQLYHGGLTVLSSAQTNAVLAGFWTNRNAAKSRYEREIDIGKDTPTQNGAPTGQGLADKAALQAYKSPNDTGPIVWTVTTN